MSSKRLTKKSDQLIGFLISVIGKALNLDHKKIEKRTSDHILNTPPP